MPVGFDRHMVGYAAPACLDDALGRYTTLLQFRNDIIGS